MSSNPSEPSHPVAATYSGPGPKYGLPTLVGNMDHDPRSKHRRGPAYSFGMRGKQETIGSGPGPRYNPETKLCRPSPPSYSMHFRPKDQDNFKTPGPGTYAFVETGEAVGRPKAPAYNFGSRPKERRTDNTPGPNKYDLPRSIGRTIESQNRQAPSISIKSRPAKGGFNEDLVQNPGPGTYPVVHAKHYKHEPPHYSMSCKTEPIGDRTNKPGPASYQVERVSADKRQPPRFSFGIRHSAYAVPLYVM
jgi:hypothetical protein